MATAQGPRCGYLPALRTDAGALGRHDGDAVSSGSGGEEVQSAVAAGDVACWTSVDLPEMATVEEEAVGGDESDGDEREGTYYAFQDLEDGGPRTRGRARRRRLHKRRRLWWGYVASAAVPLSLLALFVLVIFSWGLQGHHPGGRVTAVILSFSDSLTALSYFFIPGAIFTVAIKREDIDRSMWTVWMFGAFIVCCGLTHLISALCFWWNLELVQVGMKAITAAISYATAISVYRLIPLALAIPSPVRLEEEVNERKKAQRRLQHQYKRTCVLARVTKEIRKNLRLQDICNATAIQCAQVFGASLCSIYRQESVDDTKRKGKEKAGAILPANDPEGKCVQYRLISQYELQNGQSHMIDKKEGEMMKVPPLHLLRRRLPDKKATSLSIQHPECNKVELDEELLRYYRTRRTKSIMSVAVAYHPASCILIVLEERDNSRRAGGWGGDDIDLLKEVSAQVSIGLEHAHLLREAVKGRKLAWHNLALERAREKAEQSSKAKSEFLAVVSHEIRTPMNAICGMAKVLKGYDMPSEQRECVRIISSSAKALLSLLSNILDFTKIEAGKTEIRQHPFNLYKCIRNLMGLMSNYTAGKNSKVAFSTIIDPNVAQTVVGDKLHLRQILINLLSNARKFTSEGSITLRVITKSVWEINHNGEEQPEKFAELQFEVIDTGIGIPQEKQNQLFLPFSQVDSSATRKYAGTGLGLVISRRLCELMGGEMTLKSQEGKGSHFTFTVKVKLLAGLTDKKKHKKDKSNASQTSGLVGPDKVRRQGSEDNVPRILLAEDNRVNQTVACKLLHILGYTTVTVVGNGKEAVEAVQKANLQGQPFSVILMDLHMPEMDGITAIRLIRQKLEPHPFIIACTADLMNGTKRECLEVGVDGYLEKPIKLKDMASLLARAHNGATSPELLKKRYRATSASKDTPLL